jgi:hypothetical protein
MRHGRLRRFNAWRDEKDKAFEWLDRAYAQRDIGLAELKGEQLFRNLFRDSRWAAFLKEKNRPCTGIGSRLRRGPWPQRATANGTVTGLYGMVTAPTAAELFGCDGRPAAILAAEVDHRL